MYQLQLFQSLKSILRIYHDCYNVDFCAPIMRQNVADVCCLEWNIWRPLPSPQFTHLSLNIASPLDQLMCFFMRDQHPWPNSSMSVRIVDKE